MVEPAFCYPQDVFETRSLQPERIDTGDYTPEEYERFLHEIAFINRYLGDRHALKKTLFREIERAGAKEFSVLDVGCGSGELLRTVVDFGIRTGRKTKLVGLDLNEISANTTRSMSADYPQISTVRGDAFALPFESGSFDYAISSLFFHHLTDEQITRVLEEMSRVSRKGIVVIDLHRHPMAYVLYKLFCSAFRISPLVRQDGALSIKRGFRSDELRTLFPAAETIRAFPFRIVLSKKLADSY